MSGRWVDLREAAELLGTSTEAVRKRAARGSLRSERRDGRVLVWVDEGRTEGGREAQVDGGALVEVLTDQVTYLRSQLDQEREARRRADTIIAQLTQATSNLTDRLRELEVPPQPAAPSQEASDGSQSATEDAPGAGRPADAAGAPAASERVSWWRRVFGS
jgi:hypothetical protein